MRPWPLLAVAKDPHLEECRVGLAPVCVRKVHGGERHLFGLAWVQMVCVNRFPKSNESGFMPDSNFVSPCN